MREEGEEGRSGDNNDVLRDIVRVGEMGAECEELFYSG